MARDGVSAQRPAAAAVRGAPSPQCQAEFDRPPRLNDRGVPPPPGSPEGILCTLVNTEDVAETRAEVAAQTDTATCPQLPDGGTHGAPGEG